MDFSVPPIVRGEFFYRDALFVDVGGEGKRHPRALESELKALLNGKSSKDQVGHWYEAQLIHYGLQRSKEKNTAKVRLQQALNQGKLRVPPHLLDMEAQMKKDYTAAARKAKSQNRDTSATKNATAPKPKGRKRTNGDDGAESSKRTKISMSVGDISINIDHSGQSSTSRKSNVKESKQAVKLPPASKSGPGNPTPRGKASNAADSANKSASKQEPRRKATPSVKTEPKPKPEPQPKSDPRVKKEPSTKRATPIKKERKIKDESPSPDFYPSGHLRPSAEPPSRNVTGTYSINCPELSAQFADDLSDLSLSLCVDNATGTIWGSFTLAWQSGVLRIDNYDADETMTFGWRARDGAHDDRLRFGRGCFGRMELYGREQVRGWFENLFPEPVSFDGRRAPGPLWCGRDPYDFEEEWDGFVSQAYGR